MAGTTVTASNLEALGAPCLAALLLAIGADDATVKRRLRLAIAGSAGPAEAARLVGKRLATIAASRTFLERQKAKTPATGLDSSRRAIRELVRAPHRPHIAQQARGAPPGGMRGHGPAGRRLRNHCRPRHL